MTVGWPTHKSIKVPGGIEGPARGISQASYHPAGLIPKLDIDAHRSIVPANGIRAVPRCRSDLHPGERTSPQRSPIKKSETPSIEGVSLLTLILCPRGDLNPHARNRALAPQASASTIPPPGHALWSSAVQH